VPGVVFGVAASKFAQFGGDGCSLKEINPDTISAFGGGGGREGVSTEPGESGPRNVRG